MLQDALESILLLGLMGFLTNAIAYKFGFFIRPACPRAPLRFVHLVSIFAIYLGFLFLLPTFVFHIFKVHSQGALITLQLVTVSALLVALIYYIRSKGQEAFASALKNRASPSSRWTDFGLGVIIWFVAFPWVGVVSQICDLVLELFFNFQSYEQVAVRYLKENLQSTPQTIIALFSIVVIAPIVEELLFRGTLQQYLKKYFSVKTSIIVTALIFSCFHFSYSQGLGNFSLIPSLFTFACFLGYIYERQGSIFASIGLHLTFNCASSLQILFFSEG